MVRSSLKKDTLKSKSFHIVPPLKRPFFHLLTPPRFGALSLPEVKQFTGNCLRLVRIVLKVTFLTLTYPKGVSGRLPLCPIMALGNSHSPLNLSLSQQGNTQTLGAARFKPNARFIHVKTKRYMPYHRNVIYNPSNIQLQKTRSQAKLN